MNVLVLNCGSSSIKYQLLNMDAVPVVLAKGIVEKIGLTYGSFTYKPEGKDKVVAEQPIMDHSVGMDLILKALVHPDHGVLKSLNEIDAVGHRVAHGGEYFSESVKIDDEAKAKIKALGEIAPLHNPANLKGSKRWKNCFLPYLRWPFSILLSIRLCLKKLSFMVFLTNIMKNTESEDMASTVLPINL